MIVEKTMTRILVSSLAPWLLCTAALAQNPPAADSTRPAQGDAQTGRRGGGQDGGADGQGRGGGGGGNRMFGPMGRSLDSVTELREQFQPYVLRRDVPLFRDELHLSEGQTAITETLVHDYETVFTEASDAAQAQQREMMRQMFQGFMGGGNREKFQESFQKIQADLEQMAVEAGGELPPEMRRQYFREQMQKVSETLQKEREASGAVDESRRLATEMSQAAEKWRKLRTQMEIQLLDGIRGTLTVEQVERWAAFERFLRREKSLSRGRLSGESVNLFSVIDEAGISKESLAKLLTILDEYEIRLDEALKHRNEYLGQNESKALKAIQESDAKSMEQLADRMIDLRNTVRNTNDQFRAAIAAALPPDEGQRVEKAALASAFGRVYRPTQAERSIKGALEMEDLTPDVRKAVEELSLLYGNEIDVMNQRIAQTMRKSEPERLKQDAIRASGLLNGGSRFFDGGEEDPTDSLFAKRGEVSENYIRRLSALLTPEQVAKLPKASSRDGGRRNGPFGTWTIADMPQESKAAAKAADKDGNGVIEGDERRELMRGMGGPDFGNQGGGRNRESNGGDQGGAGGRPPATDG